MLNEQEKAKKGDLACYSFSASTELDFLQERKEYEHIRSLWRIEEEKTRTSIFSCRREIN